MADFSGKQTKPRMLGQRGIRKKRRMNEKFYIVSDSRNIDYERAKRKNKVCKTADKTCELIRK